MYEIKEVIIGNSESGNAGCNNGIYDRFVMIGFTNGFYLTETTCRCGQGCSGSFPVDKVRIGAKYNSIQEFYDSIYGEGKKNNMAEYIKWFVGPQFNKRDFIKILRYRMNVSAAEVEDGIILDKEAFNLMPSALMPHWAFINKEDINSNLHTRAAGFDEYKAAMQNDTITEEYLFEEEQRYV